MTYDGYRMDTAIDLRVSKRPAANEKRKDSRDTGQDVKFDNIGLSDHLIVVGVFEECDFL